jgi:hypothetical protein
MDRACLFLQRWHSSTRLHGVTTHSAQMWLYWGYVPIFTSQDASNWNFVKFWDALFMHQLLIFSKRHSLPRFSTLSHSYDSSVDSSQLFVVHFFNEIGQGLPQRKSRPSCGSGTSLHSPALVTCNKAVSVAATGLSAWWIQEQLRPAVRHKLRLPNFL